MSMEAVLSRVCGLDLHKKTTVACRRIAHPDGRIEREVRTFGTMTQDLIALSEWLVDGGVTNVAMESTGVLWKPVWDVLQDRFELLLVNAAHIKKVPGRKTDVSDSEWIAQLLAHGLLRGSFVPPQPVRELRDLTRHRVKLVDQRTAVVNRIHKVLEDANLQLANVASDILGVSGRAMLKAMVSGEEDPRVLADLARRRLRGKVPQLQQALTGRMTEHRRFMLRTLMSQVDFLEGQIEEMSKRIAEKTDSFRDAVQLLQSMSGIGQRTAESLIAEIGPDMSVFPTSGHLASWAGMCPGNDESAGKRRSGRTSKGSHWLRRALTEAAWAASRKRNSYARGKYHRLARKAGKKRALVAVGHHLLVAAWMMLSRKQDYRDLGENHFDRRDEQKQIRYHMRRLSQLGQSVTVVPIGAVA